MELTPFTTFWYNSWNKNGFFILSKIILSFEKPLTLFEVKYNIPNLVKKIKKIYFLIAINLKGIMQMVYDISYIS